MKSSNKISTLKELEAKQLQLKKLMDYTSTELVHSVSNQKSELKGFALKNIGIPLGVLGLGSMAIKQFNNSDNNKVSNFSSNSGPYNKLISILIKLLPFVLSFIKSQQLKQKTNTSAVSA